MDIRIIRVAILAFTIAFSGLSNQAYAQSYENTPVSISKEKVKINGEVCYSHVVLERQTLFSISKAYNVSIDDIYRLNPSLKESGLIKNSIILISSAGLKAAEEAPAVEVKQEENIQPEKQEEAQPIAEPQAEEPEVKTRIHTVKWYENISDIAAKYGITVDELMAANNLKGKKLKSRMKLNIPDPGEYVTKEVETTVTEGQQLTEESNSITIVEQQEEQPWWVSMRKEKVRTSLLLPLKATGTASSRSNMDFYSGVLLAVKDLAQSGISTDLIVHDIADGKLETSRNDIGSSDLIIGPVSTRDISGTLAMNPSSMLISPLDPKAESLAASHPTVIQAPTPHKVQYDDLASWIKEDKAAHDRVLLITEKGARQNETLQEMKSSVDSSGISYSLFSYSILEGRDVLDPLKNIMTKDGVNRVMIVSESEAFVNDVVRNLGLMIHQKYNVVLYASSKIRSFETIEVDNFHKTQLHVSLTYYIDYEDVRVKSFLMKYRALFNAEPSQFAFQGYDVATYFIELCSKYGNRWPEMLDKESKAMLQSTFMYKKADEGGYINNGVRRIVYGNGWKVNKLR